VTRAPSIAYDPDCYLCPGNERASGARNPSYEKTFIFDNDFPALLPDAPAHEAASDELLRAESVSGVCRVVCFSPHHHLTLGEMGAADVEGVIGVWAEQCRELGARPDVRYIQVFENRGEMMGCSNPHPHCQLWASDSLPNEIAKELASQSVYFEQHQRPLLADYLANERTAGERIVAENDEFVVAVPFWALWPFETVLLPKRPATRLQDLDAAQRAGLARALRDIVRRYDRLFGILFPYSMGFHQAPWDGEAHPEWTLHGHFYPPLLRSATVRKFMVGYEMLATPQRDITPEEAARRLREMDPA